jgi:hypothetical protein
VQQGVEDYSPFGERDFAGRWVSPGYWGRSPEVLLIRHWVWVAPMSSLQRSILRPALPSAASISARSRGGCGLAELQST